MALAATMLLVVAACGDDDDGGDAQGDTGSTATTSAPQTTTAGDSGGDTAGDANEAWSAIEAAAAEEGEVVVYTSIPGADTFLPEAFGEAYPDIQVTVVRANSADLVTRMEQERAAGSAGADIAMHTNGFWFQTIDGEGDITPFDENMPALEAWPEDFLQGNHASAATLSPQGFGFNTDLQEPFDTWDGFLDPALQGNIAVCDPVPGQTAQLASYSLLDEEFGPEYVDQLGQQGPDLHASTTTIAQGLAAGEYAATTCMLYGSIKPLQDEGAPVEFVVPTDIALGLAFPMGVTGWAQHPNAAQVFANWLLSEEGQTALVELQGVAASPLEGIPNAISRDAVTPYDAADFQGDTATQLSQDFTARLRGG
jgi:iron(III) transport system substrate-binding protein